jgi:predicted RNA-binding protein with PUA-like domain
VSAYWLFKTEPSVFGIGDLERSPGRTAPWDGVRNYQARNFLRAMQRGDRAFLYHSSCASPGIAGVLRIARAAYPDPSAFDPRSPHFDPASDARAPRWFCVDVSLERRLRREIALAELRSEPALAGFRLLARGNRLSVLPVEEAHWRHILTMEKR